MKNKIGRYLLKNYLSFENVDLNFKLENHLMFDNIDSNSKFNNNENNLILFTGPSGSGKSILLNALVSSFGSKDILAEYSEIEISNNNIEFENFELLGKGEDFIIKYLKKDKIKFFIDDKTISKNKLKDFSSNFVKHLHLKDTSEFESKNFIKTIDNISFKNNVEVENLFKEYKKLYLEYSHIKQNIEKIKLDEKNIEELKEFTLFEINKIKKVNPKANEYEELQIMKKRLSEKDNIENKITKVNELMNKMGVVNDLFNLLNTNTDIVDEFNLTVNNTIEKFYDSLEDLNEMDIESILDRISDISNLIKKYGSIEDCLKELEEKENKLKEYENISFKKEDLLKREKELIKLLNEVSNKLTKYRKETCELLKEKINYYLKFLYLDGAEIIFEEIDFNSEGKDKIRFELNNVDLETISSGEFNRLRLALLTARTDFDLENNGILFLDEIDANLSGKESESIAKVVTKLSKSYQIFAISHQPQLTSQADKHYLVEKHNGKSTVRLLNLEEREVEISRMISGENITKEAKIFAKNLLKNK